MKELLNRVIGMQQAKVRRFDAALLFRLLTDFHPGAAVGYDNAYTVTVDEITVYFAATTVDITTGVLPGGMKVKPEWGTVHAILTVIGGLLLITARISSPSPGAPPVADSLFYCPDGQDELAWTKSATPAPVCCSKPMTERTPDLWGSPATALYVERIFRCPCCGNYQYQEVTDTTEAALLYTEVSPW